MGIIDKLKERIRDKWQPRTEVARKFKHKILYGGQTPARQGRRYKSASEGLALSTSTNTKVAKPTGERFARSPSFLINGEKVKNPCADRMGAAAQCVAKFLSDEGVTKVVVSRIGANAKDELSRRGIEISYV